MPSKYLRSVLFLLFLVLNLYHGFGQKTIVKGKVLDSENYQPMPFVNITFLHSTAGTISDNDGNFYVETLHASDTILASSLGYDIVKKPVRIGATQEIIFVLNSTSLIMDEVVIKPGENPAFKYLQKINEHKKQNNPEKFKSYKYHSYNKMRMDLNNIDETFKEQPLFKNFQFAFDYMDSSEVFGKNYLPVLISESTASYFYQKDPKVKREIVSAFKISGVENSTVSQFSGRMYQEFNIYDNFMTLFEPGFVSPIADFGKVYYKYYLEDSASIDGSWCYKISFKPKRKVERTFFGYFWVADTSFAIKKIQLRVSPDVNINLLNDMVAVKEYSKINDSTWFTTKEEMLLDFYLTDKSFGVFGQKVTLFDSIEVDIPIPDTIANLKTDIYVQEKDLDRNEEYWEGQRKSELTNEDANVYKMVDSVQQVPFYKTIFSITETLINHYYVTGPVEIGPYYTFYSYNPIEGNRFRFGGRTSNKFSTKLMVGGYAAYGLHDERYKYGVDGMYMFGTNPRRSVGVSYLHDIQQLGKSDNAFLDDNFMASFLRRRPNYKLTMVDQFKGYYEHEWYQGFSNTLSIMHKTIYPTEYVPFNSINELGDTTSYSSITSAEITLSTHFAYHEKFLLGKFERVSLGSFYPAIDLDLTYGPKGFFNSNYEYFKVKLSVSDKVEVNPFGYFRYRITLGKIFGTLPYSLLELHDGNETYAYDPFAFNMMNYYEFVSDRYLILSAEHHFQGFFLNHFPVIRRLGFREVISGKMLIGSLRAENNQEVMEFPAGLSGLTTPYYEAGVGLENILRFFRIEAMWRFSYTHNPEIQLFGFRATVNLSL